MESHTANATDQRRRPNAISALSNLTPAMPTAAKACLPHLSLLLAALSGLTLLLLGPILLVLLIAGSAFDE
ncbi:MAG: hypothetical protein ACR2RF_05360 [Geminicoccaceae bacterium]